MWDKFINGITTANDWLNALVWGIPMVVLILGTGLLLTIRTKCLQVAKFHDAMQTTIVPTVKSIGKKKQKDRLNTVSQFEAFSAAISGTVGTGNIIGVTSAILTGGPGAVFWMWISAFFGMVTNYSENVLGLYYRKKDKEGNLCGGSFYYISNGMGKNWKWLGYVSAVFCVLAAIGMSGVQTNKISGSISDAISTATTLSPKMSLIIKLVIGIVVAILAGLIIIGGIKRIGKVASLLVPFMSLIFMLLAIIGILMNAKHIGGAFGMIFTNAFNFKAAGSGIFGYAFAQVIQKGLARGVFSNEAGLGSSVIAHSASETREPVKQGLWGVFEVFFDTFIICTLTALLLLTTLNAKGLTGNEADTAMAIQAFSDNFGKFGIGVFAVILPLFAFTTIMAWAYYGEKAVEFCFSWTKGKGSKIATLVFKILYILLIIVSSVVESELVWGISDTFNGLMAIPNLIAVVALNGTVVAITKNYYARKKGRLVSPMLSAYPELNGEFKNDIVASGEDGEMVAKKELDSDVPFVNVSLQDECEKMLSND